MAPNKIGKTLAKKYNSTKVDIYEKAEWKEDSIFNGLFREDKTVIANRINSFVVPKIEEGIGLNFLDKSAKEYIDKIKEALIEKKKNFDKPIAFLATLPYRGDDDKTADAINYKIHPTIIDIIGGEAAAGRYICFLAQMKLICDHIEDSGLDGDSRLLIFTKSGC